MTRRLSSVKAPDRGQWLVLPGWRDEAAVEVRLALSSRRLALAEAERIYRPDRSRAFTVYRIVPVERVGWRLIADSIAAPPSRTRAIAQGVLAWTTLAAGNAGHLLAVGIDESHPVWRRCAHILHAVLGLPHG